MKTSPLFSEERIALRVDQMAREINLFYGREKILAIGILKGAFVFYSDLLKRLEQDIICDFCAVSFYGNSAEASPEAFLELDITQAIKGRHVLIIDCISDFGHTVEFIRQRVRQREPKSIHTAVLLTKPAALQNTKIDFKGFETAQDDFVVGYGIDYKDEGRSLPYFAKVCDLN